MAKSYSKIRHIQEANKRLEDRLIIEGLKTALNEAYLPIIQEGDELCDILCGRKQAKYGSNGDVVKKIQNALNNCGFNVEKQGGGINEGCKEDWTKCDGKFRKETKTAVEQFQKATGLTPDGAVGYRTLTKMGSNDASTKGGCIQLPKCDCKKTQQDVLGDKEQGNSSRSDWWTLVDIKGPKMDDCDTINKCLYKAINGCKGSNYATCFSDTFFKCMGDGGPKKGKDKKCGDCPEYINRMPGPNTKELTDFEAKCIKSGCSKVAQ
jgi:peptidoglycan hydrolase-like protein with peptidoglycan-binding domain